MNHSSGQDQRHCADKHEFFGDQTAVSYLRERAGVGHLHTNAVPGLLSVKL